MERVDHLTYDKVVKLIEGHYFVKIELIHPCYKFENNSQTNKGKGYSLSGGPIPDIIPIEVFQPAFVKSCHISSPYSEGDHLIVGTNLGQLRNENPQDSDIVIPLGFIRGLEVIV
jgi:hypothetical protein